MGLGMVLNRNRQVPAEDSPAFGAIAERFRRAGDLERAVALCQEGLAKFPGHLSARVTLGWSFLDLGKYDEARAELEQVLKRAPDNLAAIRGLAELHDRAEHDEMAAMHRDGSKWMTEAAAAGVAASEPPQAIVVPAVEARHVAVPAAAVEASIPQPKPTPAIQTPAPKAIVTAPVVDDELEAGIAALGVFSATKPDVSVAAPAKPEVPASFAVPTTPEPVAPKAAPVASTFAAPTKPEAAAAPEDSSPWQPVEIESAAAHLLEATASSAWRAVEPVKSSTSALPAAWQPEVVEESASFETPAADLGATDFGTADLGTTVLAADTADFPEFAEFANLGDVAEPAAPAHADETLAARAVETTPAAPTRAAEIVPVIDLSAMAPVAADTPTLIQPRVPSLEELDPELPALVDDAWTEQQDVYVLPAAVEAQRAIEDEGPGVWPPVIPDDPADTPMAASDAVPAPVAAVESPAVRRPSLNALNKFLRRVETRRSAVVAEYLAG